MFSSSNETNIEFQLHFIDCNPDSIIHSSNSKLIVEHLYRAATNRILKFETTYQRKGSNRVTDIDQLSLLLHSTSLPSQNTVKHPTIEIRKK